MIARVINSILLVSLVYARRERRLLRLSDRVVPGDILYLTCPYTRDDSDKVNMRA